RPGPCPVEHQAREERRPIMAATPEQLIRARVVEIPQWRARAQSLLPRLVLAPSFAAALLFVYGFILFTTYLSFTNSRILPSFELVGLENYVRLFELRHWWTALGNLAIFGGL